MRRIAVVSWLAKDDGRYRRNLRMAKTDAMRNSSHATIQTAALCISARKTYLPGAAVSAWILPQMSTKSEPPHGNVTDGILLLPCKSGLRMVDSQRPTGLFFLPCRIFLIKAAAHRRISTSPKPLRGANTVFSPPRLQCRCRSWLKVAPRHGTRSWLDRRSVRIERSERRK